MAATMIRTLPLLSTVLVLLAACDGGSDKDSASAQNCRAPVANAGADADVSLGDAATLDASGSEWCQSTSSSLTFSWSFLSRPVDSVVDDTSLSDNRTNTAITPVFTPDVLGDYVLSLVLTDANGESAEDIVVISSVPGDQPPVADCGGSYKGVVGTAVSLDGSGAYDPENAELEYSWSLSVPECSSLTTESLRNQGGPTPTFVPDCSDSFEISMVVSDGAQWSDPVVCVVDVAGDESSPVADAGVGGDLGACVDDPLQLNGYGSYDPEGDALVYEWSVVSVPKGSTADNASFSDRTDPAPWFDWDVVGTYVVQLQVSDGEKWSSPDIVSFTISGLGLNKPPISNAGADIDVDVTVTCESSSYIWSCPDCAEIEVELDGSASYDPDGDGLNYDWTESTGTVDIVNPYAAITSAIIPAQAAEYKVANAIRFAVELSVADCDQSDNDTVIINYTCEGEK